MDNLPAVDLTAVTHYSHITTNVHRHSDVSIKKKTNEWKLDRYKGIVLAQTWMVVVSKLSEHGGQKLGKVIGY